MSFLAPLRRAWISIEVPGTSSSELMATYVEYAPDDLPDLPPDVQTWGWLRSAAWQTNSSMAADENAVRALSWPAVLDLIGGPDDAPADFVQFMAEPDLRQRLRSATDAYFNLGDAPVHVPGGRLLHIVSDSQWVFHWLIYLGASGESAVLGIPFPAGFTLDEKERGDWCEGTWGYTVVAESFAEFLWRWWMDNEVFFRVAVDRLPMTPSQQDYISQYGEPRELR